MNSVADLTAPRPLADLLATDRALRDVGRTDARLGVRLAELSRWQAARLAATYADFAAQPRYAPAVQFFLDELYGEVDTGPRDRDLSRAHSALEHALPARALEALRRAIELEILTQRLDIALAEQLPAGRALDGATYAEAYRAAGRREDRELQIERLLDLGRFLDGIVAKPGLPMLVRLARRPARAAGFGALHEFLERGFQAFDRMDGADEFLAAVRTRETRLLEQIYAGVRDPFVAGGGVR